MFACDIGDVPQTKMIFTDTTGAVVDPSEVTLYLAPPSGAVGTYTYSSGSVSRQAAGTYYYNGTATLAGYWRVRWVGTGAAVAAQQDRYFVRGVNT